MPQGAVLRYAHAEMFLKEMTNALKGQTGKG